MKKTLLLVCVLALATATLFAQARNSSRVIHIKEKSAIHVPAPQSPLSLRKIFSNLGKPTDAYYDQGGWYLAGPGNGGYSVFISLPFTPASNSHVSQLRAAIGYSFGANQINLSLYGDAGGVPGTLLAGPVTVFNLPSEGTCCALAIADFPAVAVTGGSRYWIVADTPLTGTGSDFSGSWEFVPKPVPFATSFNGTWYPYDANDLPAGAAYGSIP